MASIRNATMSIVMGDFTQSVMKWFYLYITWLNKSIEREILFGDDDDFDDFDDTWTIELFCRPEEHLETFNLKDFKYWGYILHYRDQTVGCVNEKILLGSTCLVTWPRMIGHDESVPKWLVSQGQNLISFSDENNVWDVFWKYTTKCLFKMSSLQGALSNRGHNDHVMNDKGSPPGNNLLIIPTVAFFLVKLIRV